MGDLAPHLPALRAFIKGSDAARPSDDALADAMRDGLIELRFSGRIKRDGSEVSKQEWHLTRLGRRAVDALLAAAPIRQAPAPNVARR